MSNNKSAAIRYKVLDGLLSDGKGHTVAEMSEACAAALSETSGHPTKISRVTIYDDLRTIETQWGVTIEKSCGRPVLYSYAPNSRTMNGSVLSSDNYSDLVYAMEYLESISGLLQADRTLAKLRSRLDRIGKGRKVIDFESAPRLRHSEELWKLYRYIRECKPLNLTYEPGFGEPQERDIQPLYLKQYHGRWYLMVWKYREKESSEGMILNYALDRIRDYSVNRSRMMTPELIHMDSTDFEEYFKDIVGVTRLQDEKIEDIVIRADMEDEDGRRDWHRLDSRPLHASQTSEVDGRWGYIRMSVRPNPEFYTEMRRFEHLEIISPERVRNEFVGHVRNIIQNYLK